MRALRRQVNIKLIIHAIVIKDLSSRQRVLVEKCDNNMMLGI